MQPSRDASEISYSHTFYSIFFQHICLPFLFYIELVLFYLIINFKFFFTTTQILHTKILFQCTHIYNFFRVGNSVTDFLVILAYNVVVIFGGIVHLFIFLRYYIKKAKILYSSVNLLGHLYWKIKSLNKIVFVFIGVCRLFFFTFIAWFF